MTSRYYVAQLETILFAFDGIMYAFIMKELNTDRS